MASKNSAASLNLTPSRVDFSYSFATPHRLTVGRPDHSDRTLLDLQPGTLRMSWTYDDLRGYPLAAFKTPPTNWDIHLTPQLDGEGFQESSWTRLSGWLPALLNTYESPQARVTLEAIGGQTAALIRVRATNTDKRRHQFALRCESHRFGENPAWVAPGELPGDSLLAAWGERADRVLLMGVGADRWSPAADGKAAGAKLLELRWDLKPGETREGFIVRPYRAYAAELPELRVRDWTGEFAGAIAEWEVLVERAGRLQIPDEGVANAWKACFADLFIMREPVGHGYLAAVPGTECYRAPNAFEAAIVAVAIDQAGLHREAANGYRMCLEMQEEDGNWNDPKGWGHLMWGGAGFKSWAAMEHYRLTGDRRYLSRVFPRMLSSSRWQETQRQETRVSQGKRRPLTYGLLPRGMGDCGLLDDGDLYGVFLPHNIWAVYADRLAVEAATLLEQAEEAAELKGIYERGREDLLSSMERGAIQEDGYRWIPGVPGKTSGSRWGTLNALTPTGLLPADHELITGTLRKIESHVSAGGLPVHTGWMADGMWVAITLDNIAAAHLARGNGDAAANYLYATLNHGTPLYTWCEERGQEPGTEQCSGDRQHLWTPVAVVRCLRDCLVRENDGALQRGPGVPREWLGGGQAVGVDKAPTHFGPVSYQLQYDAARAVVTGEVTFPRRQSPETVTLYLRLPEGLQAVSAATPTGAELLADEGTLRWTRPGGTARFEVAVQ
ncbi:MAG: hypothetical protein WCP21_09690 [Armatimonadota bacterium]